MANGTSKAGRYTVTYTFDGGRTVGDVEAVELIREAVADLQGDDLDIAFLGATQGIDGRGRLRSVSARYEAPTQGVIGLLNCQTMLPACAAPQRTDE